MNDIVLPPQRRNYNSCDSKRTYIWHDVSLAALRPAIARLERLEEEALEQATHDGTLPTARQSHAVEVLLFLDYGVYQK